MNVQEYLKQVRASQELSPEGAEVTALHRHKKEITDFLRKEFGATPEIKYAGSYAKGTMIKENYDLDIVCYFPSSDLRSLKEIHDEVKLHLESQYAIEEKASAVRVLDLKSAASPENYHIDVVPGRFIADSSDVFLHVTYGDKERMQTNLKTHINHIVNSHCEDIIALAKLWNCRNNLSLKTFVIELFVAEALSGFSEKHNFQKAFKYVLESFRDDFETTKLVDPANSNNTVSTLMSSSHKSLVAQAAEEACQAIVNDDLDGWRSVFQENSNGSRPTSTAINNPSGQWSF